MEDTYLFKWIDFYTAFATKLLEFYTITENEDDDEYC